MNDKYILDDNGNPIPCEDLMDWGKWMQTANRHVGLNEIGDVKVSTVFLGLNHNYMGGAPLIYETMIFGGAHDSYQERYSTKEEALIGHQIALDLVMGIENTMTEIEQEVTNIVNATRGIKHQILMANLLCKYLNYDESVLHNIIEGMIIDGKLVEIQYEIPGYGYQNYIVPSGSVVRV